jgi:hypothetical protein
MYCLLYESDLARQGYTQQRMGMLLRRQATRIPTLLLLFASADCIGRERRMHGAQQEFPDVTMDIESER